VNHINTDKQIYYPVKDTPKPYELTKVAKNLFWLRMPMPFALNHINLWLIEDEDGWTLIDTGLNFNKSKRYWQKVIKEQLKGKPIKRVICTHLHPDHIGLSGWLCEQFDAQLWMSQGEYEGYKKIFIDITNDTPLSVYDFYVSGGATAEQAKLYDKYMSIYTTFTYSLPDNYKRLVNNEIMTLGGYEWQVVVGSGHSPEHVCLWCKTLNIIISGDQILPTISSNISVYPQAPLANPLSNWLTSCKNYINVLNTKTLVLPAHGKPFTGVKYRLDQLITEIESNLKALVIHCKTPKRIVDGFEVLFYKEINHKTFMLAYGESKAHFNYLMYLGAITSHVDTNNVTWYRSNSSNANQIN